VTEHDALVAGVEVVPRVALCECQTLHLDRGYDNGLSLSDLATVLEGSST
jgi:hypothetical protein